MEHNLSGSPCAGEEGVGNGLQTTLGLAFDVEQGKKIPISHVEEEIDNQGEPSKDSLNNVNIPDITIGMEFESEESFIDVYNEYARRIGFGTRKEWVNRNKFGVVRSRKLCCCREGTRKKDKRKVKKHRDTTRVECNAHIVASLNDKGRYVVTKFEPTHNHQCTPISAHLIRSRHPEIAVSEKKMTLSSRYKQLMRMGIKLFKRAAGNEHTYEIAMKYLEDAWVKVEETLKQSYSTEPPIIASNTCSQELGSIQLEIGTFNTAIPSQVKGVKRKEHASRGRHGIKNCSERKKTKKHSTKELHSSSSLGPPISTPPPGQFTEVLMYQQQARVSAMNPYVEQPLAPPPDQVTQGQEKVRASAMKPHVWQQPLGPQIPALPPDQVTQGLMYQQQARVSATNLHVRQQPLAPQIIQQHPPNPCIYQPSQGSTLNTSQLTQESPFHARGESMSNAEGTQKETNDDQANIN